ncbi:MAG: GAF domain-containing protein [Deltaproteobacteria bacterium]|nr:MAG: GAF domain-containing protein [Deltaproteobacteria bacterium]
MPRTTDRETSISERMQAVAHAAAMTPPARSLAQAEQIMAEQAKTIERLWFLVEASKVLNSTDKLPKLLDTILEIAQRKTGADRGTLFLVDEQHDEIWSIIGDGIHEREIRLPLGQGIAGYVAQHGTVVNLEDAYADERFNPAFDQAYHYRTRSVICVPVRNCDGKIVGVLQLINKKTDGGVFTADDLQFLESISDHAAIALENARIRRELQRRHILEQELDVAAEIQAGLLPQKAPEVPGLDIAARHQSTFEVGGDYYDFVSIDRDTFVFVIGDVEGKGVASAMVMANLQATFYALVHHVHSLEAILFSLNESILRNTLGAKFMTLFIGLIDLPSGGLHYINAGHVPPFVIPADGGEPVRLTAGGMAVGMFPKLRYQRGTYRFKPGDLVVAYTDGVTEARDVHDEQFGEARLIDIATRLRTHGARRVVNAAFDACDRFSDTGALLDDRVLIALRYLGTR